ncbi:IS1634 family transposase [Micromonospora sp. B11E3]|uniref:IS1634 family transposase n=1 Tax=Micromonospora sp. B11E3 TaxID=3153562 RepID=UPI00325ED239
MDGKPKMVSERYLGSAEDIEAAMAGSVVAPERTRHLAFGAVAAGWAVLTRLRVVEIVDEVVGPRRADAGASIGTYLALAALNRLVDPCSRRSIADWWAATAADRFTGIRAGVLEHRRFWDATRTITTQHLAEVERQIVAQMIPTFGLDISAVALDMTNFATYIDSGNDKASLAQHGKAKQKRADLRLVGLGLVVTRDGGIPLLSHTYPGNKPDVTQFPLMLSELCGRYVAYTAAASVSGQVTVVFDAGQNSAANFADLRAAQIGYVTSLPPSDHTDLLALPKRSRRRVDQTRFPGLTALQRRKDIYGQSTRVILTHSPALHAGQSRGLDQSLAKAHARLTELAQRLARGKTRRDKDAVAAEIRTICKDTWVKRILTWDLTGTDPAELSLTWSIDTDARDSLEDEIFGKRILVTNHDDWPIADVVAAYRSQSDAEFGFRQLKDPHAVSFSPMNHFTDQAIRVHTYTCVLALQLAHLMRRQAEQAGLHLSVRALVDALAGIGETVLIYPSSGGRPKARRMLTETTADQNHLIDIFDLHQWAPRT